MNLDTFPMEVWWKLAARAQLAQQHGEDVRSAVRKYFYKDIYSQWSIGKVTYTANLSDQMDAGWGTMVGEWTKIAKGTPKGGASMGDVLGDDSVGRASVQTHKHGPPNPRLWERYNDNPRGDRFQFVVSMGGGMVLFNRMRRACQTYIIDKLGSNPQQFVIRGWKVFGEAAGQGRSDSCCVYTSVKYTNPKLTEVVNQYIWPNIKDLVDGTFVPLGFHKVAGKPLWAMQMPSNAKAQAVLRIKVSGSAGGLMGEILGAAFKAASGKTEEDKKKHRFLKLFKPDKLRNKVRGELVEKAELEARSIVKRLYA